jgi:hypothetical protein
LALKGFLSVDKYIKLKENQENWNKLTSELENIINIVQDESEKGSDASTLPKDTCTYSSINGDSEVESNGTLPTLNIWLHLRLHAHMKSEESTRDDDNSGARDYAKQGMSKNGTDNEERHTAHKHFEVLWQKVLAQQDISKGIPESTLQILGDQPKLQEASTQLAKEAKRGSLDVIVQSHIQSMIGLLNLYIDKNLVYSSKKISKIVAKMQQHGTNHAWCIHKWVMAFLKWGNLPFHQLKWKRLTILNDEDLAEEIKARIMAKVEGGFLKAEDIIKIIASPEMQVIFTQKGIAKVTISIKMALCWLKKLEWTYGKLKNGMYLDRHKRLNVVEYRQAFVKCWMEHEQ